MTKIIKSKDYFNDLIRIDEFISANSENAKAAEKAIFGIEKAVSALKEFPEMGKVLTYADIADTGFRFIIHDEYIVFYKLFETQVHIVRVFSTNMDYMRDLFDYLK